jgi:hypothetical protein
MKDDYEELLRIYDPMPGFEVRNTPMPIRKKAQSFKISKQKLDTRHFHSLFATFYYFVRMSAMHSIYVHTEGTLDYPAVCKQHLPCSSTHRLHDTKSFHKLNN